MSRPETEAAVWATQPGAWVGAHTSHPAAVMLTVQLSTSMYACARYGSE